jgi:tRNA nucleotidyltransferase (CCA-adding enzyme)
MGRPRADVDVAVEGDVAALCRRLGEAAALNERFRTATVRVGGLQVDLAETRAETYASPGALPEVRPAPLRDDLARRDFAINAMALPLAGPARLVDPFDGRGDLERELIRVLHPRSFVDDPTRALRAARYSARLGFALDEETARLVRATDLATVSAERVDAELEKLGAEERAVEALALLREWGLLSVEAADLAFAAAVTGLASSAPWAGFVERRRAILAAALGAPRAAADPRAAARELAAAARPDRPSEALALTRGRDPVELALARAMGAEWLDRWVAEWRHVALEIGGEELLAAGVPEGPAIGRGLEAALRRKLDGEIEGREAELEAALAEARRS